MNIKQQEAEFALNYLEDGMIIGLRTGPAASYLIQGMGEKMSTGEFNKVHGLPTSCQTEVQATLHWLDSLGCKTELANSPDGSRIYTDNGNLIAFCRLEKEHNR